MKKVYGIASILLVLLLVVSVAGTSFAIGSITSPTFPDGYFLTFQAKGDGSSSSLTVEQAVSLLEIDPDTLAQEPVSIIGLEYEVILNGNQEEIDESEKASVLADGITATKTINAGEPYARVWALLQTEDGAWKVFGPVNADNYGYATIPMTFHELGTLVLVKQAAPENEFGELVPWFVTSSSDDVLVTYGIDTEVGKRLIAIDREFYLTVVRMAQSALTALQQQAISALRGVELLDVTLRSTDGTQVHELGGVFMLNVSYTLPEGASDDQIIAAYLAQDGSLEYLPHSYSDGKVTFTTTHFSTFVIGVTEEPVPEPEPVAPAPIPSPAPEPEPIAPDDPVPSPVPEPVKPGPAPIVPGRPVIISVKQPDQQTTPAAATGKAPYTGESALTALAMAAAVTAACAAVLVLTTKRKKQ